MARSRNIKPAIMDNETLAELPPVSRLLFVYLWMLADREGRLEDRPKRIAVQALPYDSDVDVNTMLDGLAKQGFIVRYEAAGGKYIQITNFKKHQTPHVRESASVIPPMPQNSDGNVPKHDLGGDKEVPKHDLGSALSSPRSPDSLIPDSLIPDSGDVDTPRKRGHAHPIDGISETLLQDFLEVRKAKRAGKLTPTAIAGIKREAEKAGLTLEQAITACCEYGWQGFNAGWYAERARNSEKPNARASPGQKAKYAAAAVSIFGSPSRSEVIDV